jgi:hypothetical protein
MMQWLKRLSSRPSIVIKFDCRGCMADVHRLEWIGEIIGTIETRLSGTAYRIKVLKSGGVDFRDGSLGEEYAVIEDGCLQEVRPGLFFYFK